MYLFVSSLNIQYKHTKKGTIMILFCNTSGVVAAGVRYMTRSKFCHVALEFNGKVIQANSIVGVHETTIDELKKEYSTIESYEINHDINEKAYAFAKTQLGKPYDYLAIIAFLVDRDWQSRDKWFCSELVAYALKQSGVELFNPKTKINQISPEDLYKFNLEFLLK